MESLSRRSRNRQNIVPFTGRSATGDDLAVARRRMRHLARWHVEPLPAMHAAVGGPTKRLAAKHREHNEEAALRMLAVHLWLTTAQSALH